MTAQRHHYVPQGYLRGFASSDESSGAFVWVYDKTPGRVPRKKSVRSIAWAPAYYAQENEDGTEDAATVETNLANTIDNAIPQILRRISPHAGRNVELSEHDRGARSFSVSP